MDKKKLPIGAAQFFCYFGVPEVLVMIAKLHPKNTSFKRNNKQDENFYAL